MDLLLGMAVTLCILISDIVSVCREIIKSFTGKKEV